MTKFVIDDYEQPYSCTFQDKYGQYAVDKGLEFLLKNVQRINDYADEEEEMQKFALTLSIVNFIKASTSSKKMIYALEDRSKIFK